MRLLLGFSCDRVQARLPSIFFTLAASPLVRTASPIRRRVRVLGLCSFRCILPALRCITLPEPVIRNRFFAPECVFIFGMLPLHFRGRADGAVLLCFPDGGLLRPGPATRPRGAAPSTGPTAPRPRRDRGCPPVHDASSAPGRRHAAPAGPPARCARRPHRP